MGIVITTIVIYIAMIDVLKKEGRILRKMRVKEKVIKMIEELPEDITVSDIMVLKTLGDIG